MRNASERPSEQLELSYARWKVLGICVPFGVFAGMTLWVGIVAEPLALLASAIAWIGFFSFLPMLLESDPQLVVDDKGIADYRGRRCLIIPWQDIKALWLTRLGSGRFGRRQVVAIMLSNPHDHSQKLPPLQRWMHKLGFELADYVIDTGILDASSVDVFNYISAQQESGRISVPIIK